MDGSEDDDDDLDMQDLMDGDDDDISMSESGGDEGIFPFITQR